MLDPNNTYADAVVTYVFPTHDYKKKKKTVPVSSVINKYEMQPSRFYNGIKIFECQYSLPSSLNKNFITLTV